MRFSLGLWFRKHSHCIGDSPDPGHLWIAGRAGCSFRFKVGEVALKKQLPLWAQKAPTNYLAEK